MRGAADPLEALLSRHDVPHDVKAYEGVGHGFMNRHPRDEIPWYFALAARLSNTRFDADATRDARRRIAAFLEEHLATSP